jgi:hypothetical protein
MPNVSLLLGFGPMGVERAHFQRNTLAHPSKICFDANSRNGVVRHEWFNFCIFEPTIDRLLDPASEANGAGRPFVEKSKKYLAIHCTRSVGHKGTQRLNGCELLYDCVIEAPA